jgi:hypothetical protein
LTTPQAPRNYSRELDAINDRLGRLAPRVRLTANPARRSELLRTIRQLLEQQRAVIDDQFRAELVWIERPTPRTSAEVDEDDS